MAGLNKEQEGIRHRSSVSEGIIRGLREKWNKGVVFVHGVLGTTSGSFCSEEITFLVSPPRPIFDPQAINAFTKGLIDESHLGVSKIELFKEQNKTMTMSQVSFRERKGVLKSTFTADCDPIEAQLLQDLHVNEWSQSETEKEQDVWRNIVIRVYPHPELASIAAKQAEDIGHTYLVRGYLSAASWKKIVGRVSKGEPFSAKEVPTPKREGW